MHIYQRLIQGEKEYLDDNVILSKPPTNMALEASRHILKLEQINQQLSNTLFACQAREQELLIEQLQFRTQQKKLYDETLSIRDRNISELKGVFYGEGQTSSFQCVDGRAVYSYPAC